MNDLRTQIAQALADSDYSPSGAVTGTYIYEANYRQADAVMAAIGQIPLWGVSMKHIWRAGDRVESVMGRPEVEVIRPGTVVEVSESLIRHEHLIVKFDDGETRAMNPDVMRHHKFKRNTPGAIDDVPACEDYCARCGRHRSEH